MTELNPNFQLSAAIFIAFEQLATFVYLRLRPSLYGIGAAGTARTSWRRRRRLCRRVCVAFTTA